MSTWKVGLVGTGWWSEKHLRAWSRIPGVEVVALCNRSWDKLQQKGTEYGIPEHMLFRSIDEMLEQANVDIIDIVTDPKTHPEMVAKAAAAGKHILCQKPFALSIEEAEEMVCLSNEASIRLMVTENWRWLQPFRLIKHILQQGELGRIHTVRYTHTDYYTPRMAPEVELPQPFFREMPKLLFYEMGVHWFDTWRWLFGTPKRIYAETQRISPYIEGEDSGIVVLGHDDFYGFLDASWATRQQLDVPLTSKVGPVHLERLVIDGAEGTLKLETSGRIVVVSKDGTAERVVAESTELDHEESHYLLQSHFITCLESGEPFQTSGEHNLTTLRMAFGVYESASTHLPVGIKDSV